jgi:MFS transporter, DHA3 family, tetracycline resistance protein
MSHRPRRRPSPVTVYLVLQFSASLFFSLIFTVNLIYHVTVVDLSPLQLVMVGTILEATAFAFEIPTGIVADVKSRKLSIILGYLLTGIAFILEGSIPTFAAVALAQVVWGIGYTFTSGATQAWIADEVGEARAGRAFLLGSQAAHAGGLLAIPVSVAVGIVDVRLPIVLGGLLFLVLAAFLALAMGEEGFRPLPRGQRSTWNLMAQTLAVARRLVARQPALLALLGIGLFYGLYSEGFDRLWTAHLLRNFAPPFGGNLQPVVWFGGLRVLNAVMSLAVVEWARRRLDTGSARPIARVLMISAGLIVACLAIFGLARAFWLAVAAFALAAMLRSLVAPLQEIWINRRIDDPQVRATIFSVTGQIDSLGQIAGGPLVGAIGNVSIRVALVASSLLLLPVLPLYSRALRHSRDHEPAQ